MPWAMLSRICTSRGESGANTCDEPGPYTESSRNSARTFEATAGRLNTFSLMMNCPARALRLASARTMRMVRSVFSAKRPSSFAIRRRLDSLRWEQECNGGALARHRLDLQRTTDELGAFAHREQADRFRAARGLHQVEAAAV